MASAPWWTVIGKDKYGPFDAEKAYKDRVYPTHICAVQGHSQPISIRNIPGTWALEADIGDEIWHGTMRSLLPSIWKHGLRPSGDRRCAWSHESGSRTNHFALTRPGKPVDAISYSIRENAN